jgi:hypothetical protein
MDRCHEEFCARGLESKGQERTRDEQIAQLPLSLPTFLVELADDLDAISTSDELTEFTRRHIHRLSATDFHRFSLLMTAHLGATLVRRAGLPTGSPALRVA